jgi:hypothetical protein
VHQTKEGKNKNNKIKHFCLFILLFFKIKCTQKKSMQKEKQKQSNRKQHDLGKKKCMTTNPRHVGDSSNIR